MKTSVVVAVFSLLVVGSLATPWFGDDDDFFDDDGGWGRFGGGRFIGGGPSFVGGSSFVGGQSFVGGAVGGWGGQSFGGFKGGKIMGKPCNQGFVHKKIGFGKGYGSKKSFGPVYHKQYVHKSVQPVYSKGMTYNNMYASSPVVSAGSIGHYPVQNSGQYAVQNSGYYPTQNNMYHGVSSVSSYPQVGGISHVGTVSSVGSYPSYNTGNIY